MELPALTSAMIFLHCLWLGILGFSSRFVSRINSFSSQPTMVGIRLGANVLFVPWIETVFPVGQSSVPHLFHGCLLVSNETNGDHRST